MIAILQICILFLVTLTFPAYTIATHPDYVESEVSFIKDYMFYHAEETTCKIEAYTLVCDEVDSTGDNGSVVVANEEDDVTYIIHLSQSQETFSYVFTETKLLYTFLGIPLTSNTYEELNIPDFDFESLRHSYSDATYEPITTLVTNHYELNKTLLTSINISIFIISVMTTFAIMIMLLVLLLTLSNKGAVKTGLGEKLKLANVITIACYSAVIPTIITTLLFLYSGSFTLTLLFIEANIIGLIAMSSNRKSLT